MFFSLSLFYPFVVFLLYFLWLFSALPSNSYIEVLTLAITFLISKNFSYSLLFLYDILIYFMVFLLSLRVLMIVCFWSYAFSTESISHKLLFFFFFYLYVCLFGTVPYTLEAFLRYLAILGFLFIFKYEKMKRWSESLILRVRPTDKLQCSVMPEPFTGNPWYVHL